MQLLISSRLGNLLGNMGKPFMQINDHLIKAGMTMILGLLAFSSMYSAIRSANWPLIHDSPLMHYIASRMLAGDVPYRDLYDMNMPGTYFLHITTLTLFGGSDLAWRLFDLLWLGFSALSIWLFSRIFGLFPAAFAALFYITFHISTGPFLMGQRDFLMCPFLMLASHFMGRYLENPRQKLHLFFTGTLLGFAVTIKPLAAILIVFFLLLYGYMTFKRGQPSMKGSLALIGGTCIAPLLTFLWLIQTDALSSFWEILIQWLPVYGELERQHFTSLVATALKGLMLLIPSLIIMIPLFFLVKPSLKELRLLILLQGTLYSLLQFFIQGKGWEYHLEPFYYFFFTLLILTFSILMKQSRNYQKFAVVVGFLFLTIPICIKSIAVAHAHDSVMSTYKPSVNQILDDLSTFPITKSDTVQVLDATTGGIHALYLLGLSQPSRFIYDIQFFANMEHPYVHELRNEFLSRIRTKKPKAIITFHDTWIPPYDTSRFLSFPKFASLLQTQYSLYKVRKEYQIYIRR